MLLSVALWTSALSASVAWGDVRVGEPLGEIYLSFDRDHRVERKTHTTFYPFAFYLIVEVDFAELGQPDENLRNGVASWEASVALPPEVTVVSRSLPQSCCGPACKDRRRKDVTGVTGVDNWIVQLCSPLVGASRHFVAVEYLGILTTPGASDLRFGIKPADPAELSTAFPQPAPGWREAVPSGACGETGGTPCLRSFGSSWATNGLLLNPESVSTQASSWSAVKARFGPGSWSPR